MCLPYDFIQFGHAMPAFDPLRWQNLYVMTGGAAAALTGLLFVAMSLHSKAITANPFFTNSHGTPTTPGFLIAEVSH